MLTYYFLRLALAGAILFLLVRLGNGLRRGYPQLELLVRRFFLTRYSFLTLALLVGVWPVSQWYGTNVLANLFVLNTSRPRLAVGLVTLMSMLTAAAALITSRVTLDNAPRRFSDYARFLRRLRGQPAATLPAPQPPVLWAWADRALRAVLRFAERQQLLTADLPQEWGWFRWTSLLVTGLFLPVVCAVLTVKDLGLSWWTRDALPYAAAIIIGGLVAVIWLRLSIWLQQSAVPLASRGAGIAPFDARYRSDLPEPGEFWRSLSQRAGAFLARLGPGYAIRQGTPPLEFLGPGHALILFYLLLTLACYAAIYVAVLLFGWAAIGGLGFPPLFFALLFVMLVGFLFTAAAFWLDRYRAPPLLIALVISWIVFYFSGTDHYYVVNPDAEEESGIAALAILTGALFALIAYPAMGKLYRRSLKTMLLIGGWVGYVIADQLGWLVVWPRRDQPAQSATVVVALEVALAAIAVVGLYRFWRRQTGWKGQTTALAIPIAFALAWFHGQATALAHDWLHPAHRPRQADAGGQPLDLVDVAQQWRIPRDGKGRRTLVVISASGGGIQASAWAARVLTGLHDFYGTPFCRSVGLVSAVSGGSLGTACVLSQWREGPDDDPLPGDATQQANALARNSSLEASAWGIACPDLLRFCFPPFTSAYVDRGWSLEELWRGHLKSYRPDSSDWRLTDLVDPIRHGRMPVVVFNATVMETGQRLLISPVLGARVDPRRALRADLLRPPAPVEFLHLCGPDSDLRVPTAVRLSATFPFVSPIPRARRPLAKPTLDEWKTLGAAGQRQFLDQAEWESEYGIREFLKHCHAVDGGYVDTEGLFTASRWVYRLLREIPSGQVFDRVLFVRIMPFPPDRARGESPGDLQVPSHGWTNEFLGPVEAMGNVRVTSQAERNTVGLELLEQFAKSNGRQLTKVQFVFQTPCAATDQPGRRSGESERRPVTPLSWTLTEEQKGDIEACWKRICQDCGKLNNPLGRMSEFFEPRDRPGP